MDSIGGMLNPIGQMTKTQYKCNVFNGYNGNCIGFNGNYNGVYWYVMVSIGGMLNPIGQMSKTQKKCNDLMVIMGIVLVLMEAIMVCTGM